MAVREMPSKDNEVDCREECVTWTEKELVLHNQYVSKLSRIDLENRFLRVYEENIQLKTECNHLRDQMKRLGTRVYRLIATQKNHSGCAVGGFERQALGAELLLSEQAQRIAVLEAENSRWRAKVEAMRQQFMCASNFATYKPSTKKKCRSAFHEQCRLEEEIIRLKDTLQRMERTINILRDGGCEMDDSSLTLSNKKGKVVRKNEEVPESLQSSSEETKEGSKQQGSHTEEDKQIEEHRARVASDVELIKARRLLATQTEELTSLKEDITKLEQELLKKQETLEVKIHEYEEVNEQVRKKTERIAELQQEIIDLRQCEQRVKDLSEQIHDLKSERDDIKAQNSQLLQLSTAAIGTSRSAANEESSNIAGEHLAALQQRVATLESSLLAEKAERLTVEASKEEDRLQVTQLRKLNDELMSRQKELEESLQVMKETSSNTEILQKEAEDLRVLNKDLKLKCKELEDKLKEKEKSCNRCLQLEEELKSFKTKGLKNVEEPDSSAIVVEKKDMLEVLEKFQQFREHGYYSFPAYPFSDGGDVPVGRYPTLEQTRAALGLQKSNSNTSLPRNDESAATACSEEGQGDHQRNSSKHIQVGPEDTITGASVSGTKVPVNAPDFLDFSDPERFASESYENIHDESITKSHVELDHNTMAARSARIESEIKYLETVQELERCQDLLRVQQNINKLYRNEVNIHKKNYTFPISKRNSFIPPVSHVKVSKGK